MSSLSIADADGVRLVTWNRPEAMNAMNDELWDATRDALLGAQADPELRCVVLTGTGRAFTAGQDLGEMMAPPDHGDDELHGYRGLIGGARGVRQAAARRGQRRGGRLRGDDAPLLRHRVDGRGRAPQGARS